MYIVYVYKRGHWEKDTYVCVYSNIYKIAKLKGKAI